MYQIAGLAFEGCQSTGLTSPFDVFNVVNTLWKQQRGDDSTLYNCRLVAADEGLVRCSNGIHLLAEDNLDHVEKPDLIVIPGIHHLDGRDLGERLKKLSKERRWLERMIAQGTTIAANCSGVFLLAETGALNGQGATTAWWLNGLLQKLYPEISCYNDRLLVENRNSYTTGSMTANLGVMLQIVEKQVGRQLAQSAARTMLIDASQSSASPYLFMQEQSGHQDSLILAVESQLQRDISQPLDMEALAQQHAVSVRTLSRRFKSANGVNLTDYLQNLRLAQSKLLLETTSLSMEQIAERVGYSSQSSLRRLLHKLLGVSPRDYRQQFKRAG